jgi:hypothetical protein
MVHFVKHRCAFGLQQLQQKFFFLIRYVNRHRITSTFLCKVNVRPLSASSISAFAAFDKTSEPDVARGTIATYHTEMLLLVGLEQL